MPTFSYEGFAGILHRILARGYTFRTIDEEPPGPGERTLYLRHDVDLSARAAARLGEIEAGRGVRATFFFLLGADTYNLLSPANLAIMRRLRSAGHRVGLHIDERLVRDEEEPVRRTLEWFDACVEPIDRVVSFHRPTPAVLGRAYRSFASAYRPAIFSPERYLSDSRRSAAFEEPLRAWLDQGRSPIQLLLHPGWWHPVADAEECRQALLRRRMAEVRRYLSDNFGKVFGEADPEDGDLGL
jgi:hypothetical protein